ncbi:hypothetical protein CLIM01_15103 [Colletotrichum limetticola]|uniref:N-acetyltransferase domain-containing protein n=1 Tax=Colletotrichum limetticola TaxID=1209924 RepID=A0ABQ9P7F2_9PEZI|nr:hypothetical protein CLIM01_15103 [Colletotrichum limetticola]
MSTNIDNSNDLTVHRVDSAEDLELWTPSLVQLLQSCVNIDPASSSIGFRAPLSEAKATEYWHSLSAQLYGSQPNTTLFVLGRGSNAIGTIQLVTHAKETHAHKVEIGKLLVAESDRGRGLGRKLMNVAESFAQDNLAKNMVLLDTATESPAREFYLKLGYTEWGICPQYAASADGHIHESSFFYKYLSM